MKAPACLWKSCSSFLILLLKRYIYILLFFDFLASNYSVPGPFDGQSTYVRDYPARAADRVAPIRPAAAPMPAGAFDGTTTMVGGA